MTETGMSLGTPQYMSPEQAMGEREITAGSDIYALGATTYEMLAGAPPFTGPTAQAIVAKIVASEPEPLSALRKTVPPHVEDAVLTGARESAGRPVHDGERVREGARGNGCRGRDAHRAHALGGGALAEPALGVAGGRRAALPRRARGLDPALVA
jgi:serine/threonine-protein kinase